MTLGAITSFSVKEAALYTTLSVSMVDYLCRTGIVVPTSPTRRGRGLPRRYEFGDIVVLKAIAKMLAAGLSVARLRKALIGLRKRHNEITTKSLPGMLLITDGNTLYLQSRDQYVEDLNQGQLAFAFVLELGVIQREIATKIASTDRGTKSRKTRVGNGRS